MTRKYELVYVVSPDATDEQVADLHTQVEGIVQRLGGQLEKTESWGRRKLAYEIGRYKEGIYVLDIIVGSGELMKEIDRRFKVTELIIRHLVVRVDEEQAVVERTRTRVTTTSMTRPPWPFAASSRWPLRAVMMLPLSSSGSNFFLAASIFSMASRVAETLTCPIGNSADGLNNAVLCSSVRLTPDAHPASASTAHNATVSLRALPACLIMESSLGLVR